MVAVQEYATFANPSFDVTEYANAVLAGEPYPAVPQTAFKSSFPAPPKTPIASSSSGQEDLSVALAKLNFGIDDVSKQLRGVIVNHHEDLLARAAGVSDLEASLHSVRSGLDTVGVSVEKLKTKIRIPYETLQSNLNRLQRLQVASDALRRISRFVTLSRRLENQMVEMDRIKAASTLSAKASPLPTPASEVAANLNSVSLEPEGDLERVVSQAALYISELVTLTTENNDPTPAVTPELTNGLGDDEDDDALHSPEPINLKSINLIDRHLRSIEEARTRVHAEMENMVLLGLDSLNQSMLASALQTASNLQVLPTLVLILLTDLTEAIEGRVKVAFDVSSLSKDAGPKGLRSTLTSSFSLPLTYSNRNWTDPPAGALAYRSRVRTEPTNITATQWANALWARMEVLVEDMATCCIKVYALERVLRLKKDPVSRVSFLDEVMQTLENKPSSTFWHALAAALEKYSKEAATGSTFLQQTLSNGYPRFLRLFHDFFAKIAVRTDTVYTEAQQSPETILILRSISRFETVYLSRSTARLNETIANSLSGGIRAPPGAPEGLAIARVAANELDSARFDALLVRSVARNVVSAIDVLLGRMNTLISRDRMATQLNGPSANPPQILNAQLASTLYACWNQMSTLEKEYHANVVKILTPTLKNLRTTFDRLVDPLLSAIRRDLAAITARLHRADFSDKSGAGADPLSQAGGGSGYMKDLVDKLDFVRAQILAKYSVGVLNAEWAASLAKHTVRTFILHASLARPLGEMGKLQLTTDMTELEFALNHLMASGAGGEGSSVLVPQSPVSPSASSRPKMMHRTSMRRPAAQLETIGEDYKALRGLRQLLFLETPLLASPQYTTGVPPLIVIHHIIVRSSRPVLSLPHALHDWSEAEYVRWMDDHESEKDRLGLIEGCVGKWEAEERKWVEKHGHGGEKVGSEEDETDYLAIVRTVLETARKSSSSS